MLLEFILWLFYLFDGLFHLFTLLVKQHFIPTLLSYTPYIDRLFYSLIPIAVFFSDRLDLLHYWMYFCGIKCLFPPPPKDWTCFGTVYISCPQDFYMFIKLFLFFSFSGVSCMPSSELFESCLYLFLLKSSEHSSQPLSTKKWTKPKIMGNKAPKIETGFKYCFYKLVKLLE